MAACSAPPRRSLVLSCEHGGPRVPAAWAAVFAGRERSLASHRGFDPGALEVARRLARALGAPLLASQVTRLLVDPNRSLHHPRLFSSATRQLPPEELARILARHYHPHRRAVARAVARRRSVLHVAVHSFTPVLAGRRRAIDVGLLYDPARPAEAALCQRWKALLVALDPGLRVARNRPYRGRSDGLATALRRRFPEARYTGVELELSQALLRRPRSRAHVADLVAESLTRLLQHPGPGRPSRRASP